MNIPFKKCQDGIIIEVRVEPRSSRSEIHDILDKTIKVRLTSAPVAGAANKQLIDLLAKKLRIKKSALTIVKGEKSRNKLIKIKGISYL